MNFIKKLSSSLLVLMTVTSFTSYAKADSNLEKITSPYSFDITVQKLITAISSKGNQIFAVIDHQKAAQENGLKLQPAKVIIFGNPKVGTQYMVKDPYFALELPLKVLVTVDSGKVKVVFEDPKSLVKNYKTSYDDIKNTLGKVGGLIKNTVK